MDRFHPAEANHMKHCHIITTIPKLIGSDGLPDGAVLGNGDLNITWGGTTDRVRLCISKADMWAADESRNGAIMGIVPLGILEILMPQLAYSSYHVEQNMDEGRLTGTFTAKGFEARLTVIVHAEENTVLVELERTWPGLSSSAELLALPDNATECENLRIGDVQYITRAFDSEAFYFPTYGIAAMKEVSRRRCGGREIIRHAITVSTNHDTPSYRKDAMERLGNIDDYIFDRMLGTHAAWWEAFGQKSGVKLHDAFLENMWYTGLYMMACCARNKNFAPGLWGNFATSDAMDWRGDYHLNYNYQLPFAPLMAANHMELLACYESPFLDFLPRAKRYAREYLGCRGAYYPVGIGPRGMETSVFDTKEHKHLFLGQKSNGLFAAQLMIKRWYGTEDKDYAKNRAYPFLIEMADFWEDYLALRDGKYCTFNDCLSEVSWWQGADYMPSGQDQVNNATTLTFVKALFRALLDITEALGVDADRRPRWKQIVENLSPVPLWTNEQGVKHIASCEGGTGSPSNFLWYIYIADMYGPYSDPEMYQIALNTIADIGDWIYDHGNMFSTSFASAARLGADPDFLTAKMKETLGKRMLPNGMVKYIDGGLEQGSGVLGGITEMLLQGWDGVLRLFPCWNRNHDASFHNLRVKGAFVVGASLENGTVCAEILSEKGNTLTIEAPGAGYVIHGRNGTVPLNEELTRIDTLPGEILTVEAGVTAQ